MSIAIVEDDLPAEWLIPAQKATIVGADIETSGLDKIRDRIACIQIYVPDHGTIMVRNICDYPLYLIQLMESSKITKVFQHAPFDLSFLLRDYPFMHPVKLCDTRVAAGILDPRRQLFIDPQTGKGSHSLKTLVYHYFGYKMDKSIAISDWWSPVLSDEQLEYAAKDVEYLPELAKILHRAIFAKDPCLVAELVRLYRQLPMVAVSELKAA